MLGVHRSRWHVAMSSMRGPDATFIAFLYDFALGSVGSGASTQRIHYTFTYWKLKVSSEVPWTFYFEAGHATQPTGPRNSERVY